MKDIIKISWDSGYYALIPEKFFPTTMELSQSVLLQCRNRNDPKYKEYMAYRDKAKELEREAKHCLSEPGISTVPKLSCWIW